jgi:hypothetical protein
VAFLIGADVFYRAHVMSSSDTSHDAAVDGARCRAERAAQSLMPVGRPLQSHAFWDAGHPSGGVPGSDEMAPDMRADATHYTRRWEQGSDVEAIHSLLLASDAQMAAEYGLPVPTRRIATTERCVEEGAVHVLRSETGIVAMFTLTWNPPFGQDLVDLFPPQDRPAYLQRLARAASAAAQDPLLGAQCLRRAIERANIAGADALRCEANPDLLRTRTLYELFGFRRYGPVQGANGLRRIYLEKSLRDHHVRP